MVAALTLETEMTDLDFTAVRAALDTPYVRITAGAFIAKYPEIVFCAFDLRGHLRMNVVDATPVEIEAMARIYEEKVGIIMFAGEVV
jgi:hypothetical protein